jgi:DNA polymerase-3 subunit delta'
MASKKNVEASLEQLPPRSGVGVALSRGSAMAGVVGQDTAVRVLTAAVRHDRMSHAYLFVGPHGVGREMVARRLAAALLCTGRTPDQEAFEVCGTCSGCARVDRMLHPDVHVCLPEAESVRRGWLTWDEDRKPSTDIKVEQIRALRDEMRMTAFEGGWRVAIFPHAERMRVEAANALLKTLEEPLPRTLLVLCAPDKGAVLETLRSRCQRIPFSPLTTQAVTEILQARGQERAHAVALARDAQGSVATALQGEVETAQAVWEEARAWLTELQDGTPSDILARAERMEKDREGLDRVVRALLRVGLAEAEGLLVAARSDGGKATRARQLLLLGMGVLNLRSELARPGTNVRLNLERFMVEAQAGLRPEA